MVLSGMLRRVVRLEGASAPLVFMLRGEMKRARGECAFSLALGEEYRRPLQCKPGRRPDASKLK